VVGGAAVNSRRYELYALRGQAVPNALGAMVGGTVDADDVDLTYWKDFTARTNRQKTDESWEHNVLYVIAIL